MVKTTFRQAGAASRRAEFSTAARKPKVRSAAGGKRVPAPAPIDAALVAADHHDEIKITREGFRATPRDDRAG
jgi:hypothetical protein